MMSTDMSQVGVVIFPFFLTFLSFHFSSFSFYINIFLSYWFIYFHLSRFSLYHYNMHLIFLFPLTKEILNQKLGENITNVSPKYALGNYFFEVEFLISILIYS